MGFEQTWADEIEADPEWQAIKQSNPALAAKVVRKFARKVARQEVKGADPRMAAFLQQNLPPVKGVATRGIGQAAMEGAREGFDQSAVGMLANAATGRPQHDGPGALQSLKDAASNFASGANTLPAPNLPALAIQATVDPSVAEGVAGGVGSMAGQLPDLVAGAGAGAAATKGLASFGVKALPAAVAGNVAVGAATGAAVTKATGGTNSDAAKNAAMMGLAGLLPFAGKIPAGRLNPSLSRPHPPLPGDVLPPPAPTRVDVIGEEFAREAAARTPGTPEYIGKRAGASAAEERLGLPPVPRSPATPAETLPTEALFTRTPEELLEARLARDPNVGPLGRPALAATEPVVRPSLPAPDAPPGGFSLLDAPGLRAAWEATAEKAKAADLEPTAPPGGSAFSRLIASEEGAARIPLPSAAEAQAAGRRAREAVGQGVRAGLDMAGRAGEPLARGHRAVVKGAEWVGDKTGVTLLAEGFEHARQMMKSPDWLPGNPVADVLRRQFISNYGVPPELLVMAREAERQARAQVHGFRGTAQALNDAFLPNGKLSTPAQREAAAYRQASLDRQITEPGEPRSAMAEDVAGESSRLSALLEEVGALSPEARARWDGHYLPRVYRDKFPTITSLVNAAAKTLKGHKARGIEKEMSPAEFEAARGEWEFRHYTGPGAHRIPDVEARLQAAELALREANSMGDWRAGDTARAQVERLTEELIDLTSAPGLKVRAWRDWTIEERVEMGEVRHASMRMLKMADRFEQDFATGRLLADIAKNPEWAQPIPHGADPMNPPEGFVAWKDINQDAPGGVKKWGKLANHWVREDVAHYLRTNIELRRNLAWVKSVTGTNLWKRFVTLYNPSYFVNNAMINVPTLELAGGSVFDLPLTAREAMDGGEVFTALVARGTLNGGQVMRDLATNLNATYARGPEAGVPGPMEAVGMLTAAVRQVEGKLGEVSQGTDDLFRLALVQRLMKPVEQGGKDMTLDQAADIAEGAFYDPTRVNAPMAQRMEAFGMPFIKVFFYQVDTMPRLILENPAKAGVLLTYFALASAGLNAAAGVSGDQAEGRRELLPEHMRGPGNHLNLPGQDAYGQPLVLDTKNWNPMAFTDVSERTAIPSAELPVVGKVGLPQAMVPGGPFAIAGSLAMNHDSFRQQPIRDPEEDLLVQAGQVGDYIKTNALPSGAFNKVDKVVNAVQGRADASGRRYDVLTAMLNVLGLKVQPLDMELALDKLEGRYEGKLRDVDAKIRAAERDLEANPQDAAKLEAEIQRLESRYDRIEAERDRSLSRAEKAFPPAPASAGASR